MTGTLCKCKKVNDVSAKRSNPCSGVHSRYAVCSRPWCQKVNSHSGLSKYGWWGPLPLVQKGQTHPGGYAVGAQYAVGMQYTLDVGAKKSTHTVGVCSRCALRSRYAVDVGAKRSTHTVDLVNMGGGDRYHTVGYAIGAQYAVGAQYALGVSAKRSNHTVDLVNMGGGDHYP